MNAVAKALPAIGASIAGGFFAGPYAIDGAQFGLIVSPKAQGDLDDTAWHPDYQNVPGALSLVDGRANTTAMAAAGCPLAQLALEASISGLKGWYIGAVDEMEICYRALKPTTDDNARWMRSGMNLSAVPPTWPYHVQPATQTEVAAFKAGGSEAFESAIYWTSTQHAGDSGWAWYQGFSSGSQGCSNEGNRFRCRLVRRVPLDDLII